MEFDLYVVYAVLGVIGLILILILVLYRKVLLLSRRYREFMRGNSGVSLEVVLQDQLKEMERIEAVVADNREKMLEMSGLLAASIRGVGVVRFNAFQNTGSDLSFSVALLDSHSNGVVISTIYGREESRTYAKPLSGGKSSYQLGAEEQESIRRAREPMGITEPVRTS